MKNCHQFHWIKWRYIFPLSCALNRRKEYLIETRIRLTKISKSHRKQIEVKLWRSFPTRLRETNSSLAWAVRQGFVVERASRHNQALQTGRETRQWYMISLELFHLIWQSLPWSLLSLQTLLTLQFTHKTANLDYRAFSV